MDACEMNLTALMKVCARELLEEDLAIARSTDTADMAVSPQALRRIRRTIRNYERESLWDSIPVLCRRIVAAILIVCTALFGMCMSVDAVREEIVHTVMKWYDAFVSVFYVSETTPPRIIEEYREPTFQLAGTEKQVVVKSENGYCIFYMIDSEMILSYQQLILSGEASDFNSENGCVPRTVEVNGYDATILEYNNGCKNLIWHDYEYSYVIESYCAEIDSDMLILIAESVK